MDAWETRPDVIRNLLNPAFMCVIVMSITEGYRQESSESIYFPILQLCTTLVLNQPVKNNIPRNKTHSMPIWINNNIAKLIGIHDKSYDVLKYINEGVLWGASRKLLSVSNDSLIDLTLDDCSKIVRLMSKRSGLSEYHKISVRIGKWFAHSGTPNTVLQYWRMLT